MSFPKPNKITIIVLIAVAATAFIASTTRAGVPPMIQYQGRLTDDAGNLLDTTVDLTFAVYNDSLGSVKLWEEVHSDVVVTGGLFDVLLGETTTIGKTVFDGSKRWLGISVDGGAVMQPMTPIVSSGYSFRSQYSDSASYATDARHSDTATIALNAGADVWVDAGNKVYLSTITDSVGIGTDNPGAPLDVEGLGHAIIGHSHGSGTAAGVYGSNDSDGFGLMGISTNGRGVTGLSTNGFGGYFYGPKNYISGDLGIGTETPEDMFHIRNGAGGDRVYVRVHASHATNWGEAGIKFQTPQGLWRLFMDDDSNDDCPEGGLGLYNPHLGQTYMTWTKEGNVGIPTYSAQNRFAVYATDNAILGSSTNGNGIFGYSQTGFGGYFDAPKHYFSGNTGFGTDSPTHRVTVNGELALQKNGVTKYHINYYNTGFNICETTVADYRLYIKDGGNVGIGTSNPTTKLHVAGLFHADAFETDAIGRANILDEVGIASTTSISGATLTSNWSSYMSREITVPTEGYILAIGCATFRHFQEITGYTRGEVAFSNLPDDLNGGIQECMGLYADVPAGQYTFSAPCQRLFYASSAGTYTYYMIARNTGDNDVTIAYKQMALLFIPTVYASKNGIVSVDPEDYIFYGDEKSDAEAIRTLQSEQVAPVTDQISSGDMAAMLNRMESLTAEIEALKSRLSELDEK